MIIVLQIAGIAAVLVGLAAIGFGIPVKEFSFGNTLILTGTIGLCTGMIMLGLSVVAMQLKVLARRIAAGPRPAAEPRAQRPALAPFPAAAGATAGESGAAYSHDQQVPTTSQVEPSAAPLVSPEPAPAGAAPPPPQRPKRNLLFTSTVRKDRQPAAAAPDPAIGNARTQPPAVPPANAGDAPAASFEDAWPRGDRGRPSEAPRSVEVPPQRRSSRPAPSEPNAGAAAERPAAPPGRPEERPAVTVLKSGVVDGMAYSLYSDGSIEAQMPEGMMRFASIDELRAHLDKRP